MRHLALPLALIAALSLSGCKTSLFGESEEAKAKQAALAAEARKVEAEKIAKEAAAAEAADRAEAERVAAAEAAANGGDLADVPAFTPSAEEDPRLVNFAERLTKAGFGSLGREELLPDFLGGLEDCKASMRTKLSFEKGYATMGLYPDAAAAKACLDVYLKMPGAAKYAHLYLLQGAYMLEMHPRLAAKDMSAIREQFKAAVGG